MSQHDSSAQLRAIHMREYTELVKAVCAVMTEVPWIHKGGKNPEFNYSYLSDADIALALQPVMAKHGLALIPVACEVTMSEHRPPRGDKSAQWRADVIMTYRLYHTSGACIPVQVAGSGVDTQDKAIPKALTAAWKYAMRQTFAVPSGDDAEKPLGWAERVAESEKVLAGLRKADPKNYKALAREVWDQLIPEHQKIAAALRNEMEKKARADAQAKEKK